MEVEDNSSIGNLELDLFTQNLLHVYADGIMPLMSVAQCQMYMDVLDALGSQVAELDVVSLLHDTVSSIQPTLQAYYAAATSPLVYESSTVDTKGCLKTYEDIASQDRFPRKAAKSMASTPSIVFNALPILAGDLLFSIKQTLSVWGTGCANRSLSTIGTHISTPQLLRQQRGQTWTASSANTSPSYLLKQQSKPMPRASNSRLDPAPRERSELREPRGRNMALQRDRNPALLEP